MTRRAAAVELHELARERGIDGYPQAVEDGAVGGRRRAAAAAADRGRWAEVRDGLAVLTLRGPGGDNALSLETLEQLADEAERAAADESVRMIAITGAGSRIFSAGADLPRVRELPGRR